MSEDSKVVELAPALGVSADMLQAGEYLAQEIRAGRIIGLAWVALKPGREYEADCAGEARREPAYTQGLILKLLHKIDDVPPHDPP